MTYLLLQFGGALTALLGAVMPLSDVVAMTLIVAGTLALATGATLPRLATQGR